MWVYCQSTGRITNGVQSGIGYAGAPGYVNNPEAQELHQKGPLPRGKYTIGAAHTETHLGPVAMRLYPDDANVMFGRSDFFIHADSIAHPGSASEGCIVLPGSVRKAIAASDDRSLEVIA